MAVRAPKTTAFSRAQAAEAKAPLEAEVAAEKAAALGRAGRALEKALADVETATSVDDREELLIQAARRTQAYFLQRELNGLRDQSDIIKAFGIPREVLVRIGIQRRS